MKRVISRSATETKEIASALASTLAGGETILLYGPLGTGKTQFTSGLAQGLKVKGRITSPTFVLEHRHHFIKSGRHLTLCHLDLFRVKSYNQIKNLGLDEIGAKDCVYVIEWPELLTKEIPRTRIAVHIAYGKEENERIITIKPPNSAS